MWIKEIFLGFIGLASGLAVSAGIFAFIITLGVVPRFAAKTGTSAQVLSYENTIFLGGMFGNLVSVFVLRVPLGTLFLCIFGFSAGVFTGCLAVALAEILDTFPIMFRRTKMKLGQGWILVAMAFGKAIGAFYFYLFHMGK